MIVNSEWIMMQKKMIVAYFKVLSRYFSEELRKPTKCIKWIVGHPA
jgi:hypothetical protein